MYISYSYISSYIDSYITTELGSVAVATDS